MSIFTPSGWYTTRQLLVGMIAVVGMGWWTSDVRATQTQDAEAWPRVITADRSEDCAETLAQARQALPTNGLATTFSLFSWNVEKAQNPLLVPQFAGFARNADLIFLQEAVPLKKTETVIEQSLFEAFVRGYVQDEIETGVLTLARVPHIVHCQFLSTEPWLRTPKAASVTLYPMADGNESLLTVNLHAINFSLGVEAYADQLSKLAELMRAHEGPVVFGGDLNTWSERRQRIVKELASELQLTAVPFAPDYRTTRFGRALDHLYVRGLTWVDGHTEQVSTSDHNPLFATLRRSTP